MLFSSWYDAIILPEALWTAQKGVLSRVLAEALELRAYHHQSPRVHAGQWEQLEKGPKEGFSMLLERNG